MHQKNESSGKLPHGLIQVKFHLSPIGLRSMSVIDTVSLRQTAHCPNLLVTDRTYPPLSDHTVSANARDCRAFPRYSLHRYSIYLLGGIRWWILFRLNCSNYKLVALFDSGSVYIYILISSSSWGRFISEEILLVSHLAHHGEPH